MSPNNQKWDGLQRKVHVIDGLKFHLHVENVSPASVTSRGTRCCWYLDRTVVNFLKSATLLRVRNSSSLSLRSRGCGMWMRWSLCDHVMTPTVGLASSLTKALLESMRSSSWTPFTVSLRMWALSKGRTSPNSAPISVLTITRQNVHDLTKIHSLIIITAWRYASTVYGVIIRQSVHLSQSINQSIKLEFYQDVYRPVIMQTMLYDKQGLLVLWCQTSRQNSSGVTPNKLQIQMGCVKIGDFRPISRYVS